MRIGLLELVAGTEISQDLFRVDSETFSGTEHLGETGFDCVEH